ncbi:MAG: ribosome biogenesis factor YjgA [Porticoccaceae bacterium]|jgi:ribosome-associated protein|nr:ribosome biogenesis factor YjgA [Porticoccaceae bacterium]
MTDKNQHSEHPEYDGPSKSQLKRDSQALQDIGKQLVEMPSGKLQKFDLPESLEEAIYEARRLKSREAKRRHLQYIGKLMRTLDIDVIQETLDRMDHQSQTYRQHFAKLEEWRDRIINEGHSAIEAFVELHPETDRQQLRNLQRQANRELEKKKPPAAARKLFTYIREITE